MFQWFLVNWQVLEQLPQSSFQTLLSFPKVPLCPFIISSCIHPHSWGTTNLLSVGDLSFLDISYKWNYTIYGLLHLSCFWGSFVVMYISIYLFFNYWILFFYMDMPHLIYSFTNIWIFGLFLLLVCYEWCCHEHWCTSLRPHISLE